MSALVPVVPVPGAPPGPPPALRPQFEDALASARRLWLRGLLAGAAVPAPEEDRRWWEWWRARAAEPEKGPPPKVRLDVKVSGCSLTAEAPLRPDGRFEVLLTADLPPAKRGWRIARQHVTFAGQAADACSVVLAPRADAAGAVVVLLPLECTFQPGGPQRLAASAFAPRLASFLHRLHDGPGGHHPVYYLACVPDDAQNHQAQLALAITSLGWPAGHVVVVRPGQGPDPAGALTNGLDWLRWLFAGQLDLVVFNFEPALARLLIGALEQAEDRARVRHLINPEDDAARVFESAGPPQPAPAVWGSIDGEIRGRSPYATGNPRPTRAGRLTRYPVVFCHGMLAFTTLKMQLPEDLNCFSPLREFLRERGFRVLFPQVPPTSGVVERAQRLREQILRWTDEPVNIVAHSMGGLDARYLITHLGMADRVRSLTTVSTPHHGTYLADWFVANFRQRVPLLLAFEAFGTNMDGFRDCRLEACREFNAKTPDRPKVRYFSYGGDVPLARVSPALRRAWHLLMPVEGPNDGMVSMASAHWGEYLGTVHADHFAQTPDAVFTRPGEDFDALHFYVRLVQDLARRGF